MQRLHYEERLHELECVQVGAHRKLEQELGEREEALARRHLAVQEEARASARRAAQEDGLKEEHARNKRLNEQLMRDQMEMKQKLGEAERTIATLRAKGEDMEEQLRDMTFHFQSQLKILQGGGGSELSGGALVAVEPASPRGRGRRSRSLGTGGKPAT